MLGCMMEETFTAYGRRKHSSPRRDGLSTRGTVLEAAGHVFAEKGYLKASLPRDLDDATRHDCDVILNTMFLGITDLHEGFSDFIELEVR